MNKLLFVFIAVATCALTSMNITAYESNENSIVSLFKAADDKYYVFLPKSADPELKVEFFSDSDSMTLTKGEQTVTIASGGKTTLFSEDGVVTATVDNVSYELNVLRSDDGLDSIFVVTESKSMDYINANKKNKESGKLTLNGGASINLKQLKGRGNTTWKNSLKKPYNIKTKSDAGYDFFNFGQSAKWAFIANAFDPSLIRNSIAYELGSKMHFAFAPQCQPITFVANGDFLGSYNLCEKAEIEANRVNIANIADKAAEKAGPLGNGPNGKIELGEVKGSRKYVDYDVNPEDYTGGYLLEFDLSGRYDGEISGFSTKLGQTVVLKEPEYATKDEVDYIADLWQDLEDAVYSESGYNAKGQHYSDLIDVPSFVDLYIHHEFTMCEDSGLTSTFFHKDLDSVSTKIFAGPVWDFDNSMINDNVPKRYGFDMTDSRIWWANSIFYGKSLGEGTVNQFPTIFTALYKHSDFRTLVSTRWKELVDAGTFTELKEHAITARNSILKSAYMNAIRWNLFGDNKEEKFLELSDAVINYIDERVEILNKGFADNSAMLYYDANGAEGYVFNDKILSVGESVKLKGANVEESELVYPGKVFKYWTVDPEGKGKKYYAGDNFKVTKKTTTLYAHWEDEQSNNTKWIIIIASIAGVALIAAIVGVIVFFL